MPLTWTRSKLLQSFAWCDSGPRRRLTEPLICSTHTHTHTKRKLTAWTSLRKYLTNPHRGLLRRLLPSIHPHMHKHSSIPTFSHVSLPRFNPSPANYSERQAECSQSCSEFPSSASAFIIRIYLLKPVKAESGLAFITLSLMPSSRSAFKIAALGRFVR